MQRTIGRFQVMALLQAARYYLLKGDLEKAKSFGLNRAIFYAWAKRSGKPVFQRKRTAGASAPSIPSRAREVEALGNENAYVNDEGLFVIGSEVQRPEDYDREIVRRIEAVIPYEEAWNAAINYLKSFPWMEGEKAVRGIRINRCYKASYHPDLLLIHISRN